MIRPRTGRRRRPRLASDLVGSVVRRVSNLRSAAERTTCGLASRTRPSGIASGLPGLLEKLGRAGPGVALAGLPGRGLGLRSRA